MNSGSIGTASTRPRRSLFQKYLGVLFLTVLVPLLVNGVIEAWLGYRDQRVMIDTQLRLQAGSAAENIEGFLTNIVGQLGWTTHLSGEAEVTKQRRFDALRLLRQVPAITEFSHVDIAGKEQVRVSRLAMDVIDGGADRSTEPAFIGAAARKIYYGPVYFRKDSEPYMTVALSGPRRNAGVSIGEVNLKLIWDVISKIKVGDAGLAYVVDAQGRLIAHPDITRVLRGDSETTAASGRAIQIAITEASETSITINDAQGKKFIVSTAPIAGANWTVFVEQPLSEAFAPIYAALWRTVMLLVAGATFAGILAYILAHRMTGPIQILEAGAEQIGTGKFEHRIEIPTGDEFERLANRFNQMAGGLALSQERSERIVRLKQFLAPQVAELIENAGQAAMLDSQRVDVVVIFCDLRNFTSFSAKAEPDEIMRVLGDYYSALGPIITKYEATQTSFSGDGLMMLLNAPLPCAEPALRAIGMANEMRETIEVLCRSWRARGHSIGFGMGLAKGLAVVGRIGYESRLDYTAIGNVVNLASRLCSTATDGQILIDPVMAGEVANAFVLENLGTRALKGYSEETFVYAVIR